ncbi:MAG: hypothetical protein KF762_11700 [Acidobacteria bacterium]|nr:hypothetical protein [Acidobacteriota bacterium]
MKRNTTVLFICVLFIVADAIVLRQTLALRSELSWSFLSSVLFVETLAALLLIWLCYIVLRKNYRRQKKPASSRDRLAIART